MHEGHRERLRQTYITQGDAMLDHQALELLLTYALPRRDTNAIAHTLIDTFGSLEAVLSADVAELAKVGGVGEYAAVLLSLAGSMAARTARGRVYGKRLATPLAAGAYCQALFHGERYESFYVISLDSKLRVLYAERVSAGTLNQSPVYPRLVVESALRHGANSILLAHNHPSGDPQPSQSDIQTTLLIMRGIECIDIKLHDHIIVGDESVYSMTQSRVLELGGLTETAARVASVREDAEPYLE